MISSKNPDLTGFFIIKPRHPDKLEKNRSGWKKPAVGTMVSSVILTYPENNLQRVNLCSSTFAFFCDSRKKSLSQNLVSTT